MRGKSRYEVYARNLHIGEKKPQEIERARARARAGAREGARERARERARGSARSERALVTQTLLSRTRPCLRVYCKTANPLAHRRPFARLPTTEAPTTHSNSRSKIKLRRNRATNTPEGFALSLERASERARERANSTDLDTSKAEFSVNLQ